MSTDCNRSRIGIVQNQDRDGSGTVLDGIRDEWDRRLKMIQNARFLKQDEHEGTSHQLVDQLMGSISPKLVHKISLHILIRYP